MICDCFPQGYSLISGLIPYLKGVYSRKRALRLWAEVLPEIMLMPNSDSIDTSTGVNRDTRRGSSSNSGQKVWQEGCLRSQCCFIGATCVSCICKRLI